MSSPPSLRETMRTAWRDRMLHLIVLVFVVLAFAWSYVTPIFEAPDESAHLQYLLFVADHGRLPDLWSEVEQVGIEGFHPPLYYAMLGTFVRAANISHPFTPPTHNPQFSWDRTDSAPNYFFPVSSIYDYVHLLRLFSVMLGVISVLCTYWAAILLRFDSSMAWLAAAVTAFLPQFSFISGALNNDNLAIALTSLGIVWTLYLAQLPSPRLWQPGLLGVICGLAVLAKFHAALFLLPFALLVFLVLQFNDRKRLVLNLLGTLMGFLIVGGWFLVYNQVRYGDPGAVALSCVSVPNSVDRKSLLNLNDVLYLIIVVPRLVFQSFLGTFGWMMIYLPKLFYVVYAVLWAAALIGTLNALLATRLNRLSKLLWLAPLLLTGVLLYANLIGNVNQGRFFFPALVAISLIFVLGLKGLPDLIRRPFSVAAPIFLLTTNIYALWFVANTFQNHQ